MYILSSNISLDYSKEYIIFASIKTITDMAYLVFIVLVLLIVFVLCAIAYCINCERYRYGVVMEYEDYSGRYVVTKKKYNFLISANLFYELHKNREYIYISLIDYENKKTLKRKEKKF